VNLTLRATNLLPQANKGAIISLTFYRSEPQMLIYSRMKSVGIQYQGSHRAVVSGVLEDELYAMECNLAINRDALTLESVNARMKRFTTIRCPEAQDVFNRAEGWEFDAQLDGKIKKELGRDGCRHMAVLILECCRSFARSERAQAYKEAVTANPSLDSKDFLAQYDSSRPQLANYLKSIG
jgi:hypothetical protein